MKRFEALLIVEEVVIFFPNSNTNYNNPTVDIDQMMKLDEGSTNILLF